MKAEINIQFILNDTVIGQKELQLLEQIVIDKSISKAAISCGMSYKSAWDKLGEINKASQNRLFTRTSKKQGTRLSEFGLEILNKYEEFKKFREKITDDFKIRLSAQNRISVIIKQISDEGGLMRVSAAINGSLMSALITKDALDELNLKIGDEVDFIFKVTLIEFEQDGENSFTAHIQDISESEEFVYFVLDIGKNIFRASVAKNKLHKVYKKGDSVKIKIPAEHIIIG